MKNEITGKTIFFLGSSVTFGATADGFSFADLIGVRNGCRVVKEAVSGTTLADTGEESYVSRLKKSDCNAVDVFVCQLSTNDASRKIPLGEIAPVGCSDFDTSTVAGAIEFIIGYAKNRWNCPVVFYTNPKYESEEYAQMVQLLLQMKERYGLILIDMWNDRAFNYELEHNRRRYMADAIHPTPDGYLEQWTPYFEKTLLPILK